MQLGFHTITTFSVFLQLSFNRFSFNEEADCFPLRYNLQTRDPESGKPAFRWIGTERSYRHGSSATLDVRNSKRAFGTEISNTVFKRCNTNTSIDWKSNVEIRPKDEFSTEQHQSSGSKEFIFGPFSPIIPNSAGNENKKHG